MPPSEASRLRAKRRTRIARRTGLLACAVLADVVALWPSGAPPRALLEKVQGQPVAWVAGQQDNTAALPRRTNTTQNQRLAEAEVSSPRAIPPEERLHHALEREVQSCMRERGFSYIARPYESADEEPEAVPQNDPELASVHGYELTESSELARRQRQADDPNLTQLERLSARERDAYEQALKGGNLPRDVDDSSGEVQLLEQPDGSRAIWDRRSCRAHALRVLFGDDLRYERLLLAREASAEARARRARAVPEYLAGIQRFAECMTAHGYAYSKPREGADALYQAHERGDLSLEDLSVQERELATIDARCQVTANLDALRQQALVTTESQREPHEREQDAQWQELERLGLARAAH